MENDINPDIIRATQNSLGKYVKRPPLTEKLLRKPPFRFLHDIMTTVLKTTGFFEGLFEPDELISDNVKDRDSKVVFLNKIITVLGITTGKSLTVKPSKIVAGQEVDKTNELLQCLAFALDNNLSSDDAVKKYKEGEKPQATKSDKKIKDDKKEAKRNIETSNKKLNSTSTEKLTSKKRDNSERSLTRNEKVTVNRVKQKENVTKKESPPKKTPVQQSKPLVKKKNSLDIPNQNEKLDSKITSNAVTVEITKQIQQDDELLRTDQSIDDNRIVDNNLNEELQKDETSREITNTLNASYTIAENDLNSSLSSQDLMEVDDKGNNENYITKNDIGSNEINRIAKNPSDQEQDNRTVLQTRYEKKLKSASSFGSNSSETESFKDSNKNSSSLPRPSSVRPSSSRPGAPRLREKNENILTNNESLMVGKVNIIEESTTNEEEDDSSIVVVENQSDPMQNQQEQLQLSSNQHGHLVQQILDSQKELSLTSGKTEIEWQFGAQKAREAVNQEIDQLKFNIQALSRVANPLGKLLDHIQEDVEVMRQELQQWTDTYKESSKELLKQKSANEDSLFPLHSKLKQINLEINEKHDRINDLKIVIHKNSTRIEKLLSNGNVQ